MTLHELRNLSAHRDRRRRLFGSGHTSTELDVISPSALRQRRIEQTKRRQRRKAIMAAIAGVHTPPVNRKHEVNFSRMPPLARLMAKVADVYKLTKKDIHSETRNKYVVAARHEFFYRAAVEAMASYVTIGRFCGGRNHSTVMHGIRSYCHRHGIVPPRGLTPLPETVRGKRAAAARAVVDKLAQRMVEE